MPAKGAGEEVTFETGEQPGQDAAAGTAGRGTWGCGLRAPWSVLRSVSLSLQAKEIGRFPQTSLKIMCIQLFPSFLPRG